MIAPNDDQDTSIYSYTGKLVVMLQSRSANGLPAGEISQPVAGRPGRFDIQGDAEILTYQGADGRFIVIQAPTALDWNASRLAKFADRKSVV